MTLRVNQFNRPFVAIVAITGLAAWLAMTASVHAVAEPPQLEAATDAVTVKLLEPGTTPRREIRFTPTKGTKQTSIMTMDMQVVVSIGGQNPPSQKMPEQKMTIEIVVDDVMPNGDFAYRFEYTDIEVMDDPNNPSPAAQAIRDSVKPMIGMTGEGVTSNRGITSTAKINVPENAPPLVKNLLGGMKDALQKLSAPLPEEEVGIGAKWEVTQDVTANGMELQQTTVYELVGFVDEGFKLSSETTQSADPQQVKNPALPASMKMMLDSLDTTGGGTSTLLANMVMPVDSTVKVKSKAKMTMNIAGQQQKMDTTTSIKMTLQSP